MTRYTPGGIADTLSVAGNRYAVGAAQALGARGLGIRAWAALDDDPWGRFDPLGDGNERLQVHAAITDTLTASGVRLAIQAGGHVAGGTFGPALALRADARGAFAAVSWTGVIPGRIEESGFFPVASLAPGVPIGTASGGPERALSAEAGAARGVGTFSLGARLVGRLTTDASRLVVAQDIATAGANDVAFWYQGASGSVTMLGAQGALGWRENAASGLYATAGLTATAWPGADDSPLALSGKIAESVPALYGSARLGARATRVGTGTAALDLGATARGWSAFRGVRVHPATGLLALASPEAARLPARVLLDLDASVTFSQRATVSVRWENILSGLLYDGAALVQGEPLAASQLRFGVFWALTE